MLASQNHTTVITVEYMDAYYLKESILDRRELNNEQAVDLDLLRLASIRQHRCTIVSAIDMEDCKTCA